MLPPYQVYSAYLDFVVIGLGEGTPEQKATVIRDQKDRTLVAMIVLTDVVGSKAIAALPKGRIFDKVSDAQLRALAQRTAWEAFNPNAPHALRLGRSAPSAVAGSGPNNPVMAALGNPASAAGALARGVARSAPGNLYVGNALDRFLHEARQVPALPGHYDVVIHGTPDGHVFAYVDASGQVTSMTPQQLGRLVIQQADYHGGPIRLISCNAGAPGGTAAQALADWLDELVVAPDKLVFPHAPNPATPFMGAVTPQGVPTTILPGPDYLVIAEGLSIPGGATLPIVGTDGHWVPFLPRRTP